MESELPSIAAVSEVRVWLSSGVSNAHGPGVRAHLRVGVAGYGFGFSVLFRV